MKKNCINYYVNSTFVLRQLQTALTSKAISQYKRITSGNLSECKF